MLPEKWKNKADDRNHWMEGKRPLVLHFAGTGDHYFWRRRSLMAKPLIKEMNVGSIIIGRKLLVYNIFDYAQLALKKKFE